MLWMLLIKDLRRARHNPWPYLLNLALPLCITALIGLVFGPSTKGGGLGQIKLAVVDEDDSVLGSLLRGAMNQGDFKKHLEARFLEREQALKQINDNKISAVLILPKGFTRGYLTGDVPVAFELIKNPAQSFYPAILEELLQVAVAGLNAVARNLHSDLPEWKEIIEKEGRPDMKRIAGLLVRVGDRFEQAGHYLSPPLIGYEATTQKKAKAEGPALNIFAFLLPGMAAMFLLFLADHAIRDLYREVSARTLDRFRTLHDRLLPFIVCRRQLLSRETTAAFVPQSSQPAYAELLVHRSTARIAVGRRRYAMELDRVKAPGSGTGFGDHGVMDFPARAGERHPSMKRLLQIGHNDIRLFLRIKAGYVWLFLVPLVFVYFFGIAFRGPGAPSNPRPAVLIENRDTGFLGTLLMEELDAQGMRLVDQTKRAEAERGIRIPADFTDKVLKTQPVRVEFFQVEGSGAESAFLIELRLIRAVVALNSHLLELASRGHEPINEVGLRELAKAENLVSLKAHFAGRNPTPSGLNQSLPGTLVQFLMMNLMIFG